MLRLFPSRIELAPKDVLEATERHQHRREARKAQRTAGIQPTSVSHNYTIVGSTFSIPLPPPLPHGQLLASYPSRWPHSLKPEKYSADPFQDQASVTLSHHQVDNEFDNPYYPGNPSKSTPFTSNADQQAAERGENDEYNQQGDHLSPGDPVLPLAKSYAEQSFLASNVDVTTRGESTGKIKVSSSRKQSAFSRFFDGFDDDTSLLEGFSESLDLNSTSPPSTTRGRRSQAPEPSDGQFSERGTLDLDSSPALPPLPKSVEAYRLVSREGLPRSPLYISQAARSSSPEKSNTLKAKHSNDDYLESLAPDSTRFPQGYRLRPSHCTALPSLDDDFESPQHISPSKSSQNEDMSFEAPPSPALSEDDEQTDGASVVHHSPLYMWESPDGHHLDGPLESPYDNIRSASFGQSTRFSSPPLEDPIPPSSPPILLSDPSIQPPSTPRYLAYPARRPRGEVEIRQASPPTSSQPISVQLPLRRYSASPTPPPPGTPFRSILVYNDQLSPASQPQTPRNRHAGPFDPAFTAPAVPAGSVDFRWRWQGGRRRQLPRTGSPDEAVEWEEEQENASVEGERNRLVRRLMNRSGVMRRVNSWVRRESAEDFDRTPPAENFRWY